MYMSTCTMHLGRHPCLWCVVRGDQMQLPRHQRGRHLPRSLDSLEADYLRFQTNTNGDIRKAKEYNNVISRAFFNIPLNQVSTPTCNMNNLHFHA